MAPDDRSSLTNPSSITSSGSSLWILPSPHESDASICSMHNSSRPANGTLHIPVGQLEEPGMTFSIGSTTDSSIVSNQAQAGSITTWTTEDNSSLMIMPDDIIEQDGFKYPTPGTFGPEYWEKRRELWLSGQLYTQASEAHANRSGSNYTSLPLTSPEAASMTPSSSNSLSHYLGLSLKARGKLPSFLVNALPSSSSPTSYHIQHPQNPSTGGSTIPANPSSLAISRIGGQQQAMSYGQYQAVRASPSPLAQTKGGDDPIDRLEALLAEPGAEETDRVWKQGGLEAVWKFLIDGKLLKRGIRLGLVVKILRAGWIRDGTWPATYTLNGASRAQLESLHNDPFFASPPRPASSLPSVDIDDHKKNRQMS